MYSNKLSFIATISSSNLFLSLAVCFSGIFKGNLSAKSSDFLKEKWLQGSLSHLTQMQILHFFDYIFFYKFSISHTFTSCMCIKKYFIHAIDNHVCIWWIRCNKVKNSERFQNITFLCGNLTTSFWKNFYTQSMFFSSHHAIFPFITIRIIKQSKLTWILSY